MIMAFTYHFEQDHLCPEPDIRDSGLLWEMPGQLESGSWLWKRWESHRLRGSLNQASNSGIRPNYGKLTIIGVLHISIIFGFQEEWKHFLPTPSIVAIFGPLIIIILITTNIEVDVQNWTTTEHFATRPTTLLQGERREQWRQLMPTWAIELFGSIVRLTIFKVKYGSSPVDSDIGHNIHGSLFTNCLNASKLVVGARCRIYGRIPDCPNPSPTTERRIITRIERESIPNNARWWVAINSGHEDRHQNLNQQQPHQSKHARVLLYCCCFCHSQDIAQDWI